MGPRVTGLLEPVGPHEQGPLDTTGVTVAGQVKLAVEFLGTYERRGKT